MVSNRIFPEKSRKSLKSLKSKKVLSKVPSKLKRRMSEYSDDSSHLSSEGSDIKDENQGEDGDEDGDGYNTENPGISKFVRRRNELKDRVMKEVLDKVMPDIGAYNIDAANDAEKKKNRLMIKMIFIKFFKFIGLLELDLHDAVLSGSLYQLKATLRKQMNGKNAKPESINEYDDNGCTPLSLAVKIKSEEFVSYLLEYNAQPDYIDEFSGRTPLFFSVLNGTHEITVMLIRSGANANTADFKCVTPLMIAASQNDVLHVKLLCKAYADVDIQDENGWSALHYASYGHAPEAMEVLLEEGAARDIRDINKRKPIHIAKFVGNGRCIALLSGKSRIGF